MNNDRPHKGISKDLFAPLEVVEKRKGAEKKK